MGAKFFDSTVIGSAGKAPDFIGNLLESSTGYPVVESSTEALTCA